MKYKDVSQKNLIKTYSKLVGIGFMSQMDSHEITHTNGQHRSKYMAVYVSHTMIIHSQFTSCVTSISEFLFVMSNM